MMMFTFFSVCFNCSLLMKRVIKLKEMSEMFDSWESCHIYQGGLSYICPYFCILALALGTGFLSNM